MYRKMVVLKKNDSSAYMGSVLDTGQDTKKSKRNN